MINLRKKVAFTEFVKDKMKVVFASNFFNHHQQYLCDELAFLLGNGNFHFVETSVIPEERLNLGYQKLTRDYIIDGYSSEKSISDAIKLINDSDIIIAGEVPNSYLTEAIHSNKIIFRYFERLHKDGFNIIKYPYRVIKFHRLVNDNSYLLSAGAFSYSDYSKYDIFKGKAFKWGYFPNAITYKNIEEIIEKKKANSIFWCGRLIDWKRTIQAIKSVIQIHQEGISCELTIAGTGNLESNLKEYVKKNNAESYIRFLESLSPDDVRKEMLKSQIFLFTSTKMEGWGAVLNEAMNSGCATISFSKIGSVPFLIKENENGLIYQNENELVNKIKALLSDNVLRNNVSLNAYKTIVDTWSYKIAAHRFVELCDSLLNGKDIPLYKDGPLSIDNKLKDNWYK